MSSTRIDKSPRPVRRPLGRSKEITGFRHRVSRQQEILPESGFARFRFRRDSEMSRCAPGIRLTEMRPRAGRSNNRGYNAGQATRARPPPQRDTGAFSLRASSLRALDHEGASVQLEQTRVRWEGGFIAALTLSSSGMPAAHSTPAAEMSNEIQAALAASMSSSSDRR